MTPSLGIGSALGDAGVAALRSKRAAASRIVVDVGKLDHCVYYSQKLQWVAACVGLKAEDRVMYTGKLSTLMEGLSGDNDAAEDPMAFNRLCSEQVADLATAIRYVYPNCSHVAFGTQRARQSLPKCEAWLTTMKRLYHCKALNKSQRDTMVLNLNIVQRTLPAWSEFDDVSGVEAGCEAVNRQMSIWPGC